MNYYSNIILLRYKQPIRQITISQRLKRILHIGVFYLAIGLSLCSCSRRNTTKKKIEEMVKSWQEKEIIFPEGLIFTKHGKDTIGYNIPASEYKIILYVDSVGCTECKLQLHKWKEFITEVDSLTNGAVPILFFFYPKDLREISFLLRRDSIHIPVCIDKQNRMNRINHSPSHQMYQCFLVDKENKVICIGNPVHNRKIRDIYLSTISNGKHNPSVQPSGITRIEADKTEFDLGSLKEGDSRKICVTIRNIGKLPLIIHDARTSCGCVHIDYIERPVASGNTTEINLTYHADKKGPIHKTVSIYGNMDTSPLTINLKGEVVIAEKNK